MMKSNLANSFHHLPIEIGKNSQADISNLTYFDSIGHGLKLARHILHLTSHRLQHLVLFMKKPPKSGVAAIFLQLQTISTEQQHFTNLASVIYAIIVAFFSAGPVGDDDVQRGDHHHHHLHVCCVYKRTDKRRRGLLHDFKVVFLTSSESHHNT